MGGNVTFAVEATGRKPLSYQWWHNDQQLGDATTATSASQCAVARPGRIPGGSQQCLWAATSEVATLTVEAVSGCAVPPAGLVGWWPGEGSKRLISRAPIWARWIGGPLTVAGEVGRAFPWMDNGFVHVPASPRWMLALLKACHHRNMDQSNRTWPMATRLSNGDQWSEFAFGVRICGSGIRGMVQGLLLANLVDQAGAMARDLFRAGVVRPGFGSTWR